MLPSDKFKAIVRVNRLCSAFVGADVIDKNYKMNRITYLVFFFIFSWFLFSFLTVVDKFSEDWTIVIEVFCMVGSPLQGISKLTSGIVYSKRVSNFTYSLQSIYEIYEQKGQDYVDALDKCVSHLVTILKLSCILIIIVVSWFTITPVIFLIATGEHSYILNFNVPFVDTNTNIGYFITMGFQEAIMVFGTLGNFAGDMFLMMFFGQVSLFTYILRVKINELNEVAILLDDNAKIDDILSDIVDWHRTYLEAIEECDTIFFWITFTQITTSAVSASLTLAIMFIGTLQTGYAYLGLCFSMLYLYCGMGTLIEITNKQFEDEIYGVHWYNLNVKQQKVIKLMLMRAQMAKTINVGSVAPLSVSTGLQVTKTIYSVFMMLLNFFG